MTQEQQEIAVRKNSKLPASGILDKARSTKIAEKALWPQAMLSFACMERDLTFDQLSFSELILGELEIMSRKGISEPEKVSRMHLLKKVFGSIAKVRELYKSYLYHFGKHMVMLGDTAGFAKSVGHVRHV